MFAIADTCFLIDWSSWRRRDLLLKLFTTVFVPERVLREVESGNVIEWIASSMAAGSLSLFTETPDIIEEARSIVERTRLTPFIRGVDMPEAMCLAAGRRRGYTVLTENRGALMAASLLEEYSHVRVWRALEIISEILRRRLVAFKDPAAIFYEYERETGHRFPRGEFEDAIRRI